MRSEGELNQLISYRNEAAHGLVVQILGTQELLDLGYFIKALCQALAELVTYQIIQKQTSTGKAQEIGEIREWFKEPQAAVAIINNSNLSIGTIETILFALNNLYEKNFCSYRIFEIEQVGEKSMNREQILLNKWRTLPLEKQPEVLDLVEQLYRQNQDIKQAHIYQPKRVHLIFAKILFSYIFPVPCSQLRCSLKAIIFWLYSRIEMHPPKTDMGKKLWEIRCQALTEQSKLLTWDKIDE
ncbi:MAG: hypothetical protein F6K54_38790 [Okeania sp. SIO3B5]|uniref:MAE_28990/MAE_18760 family HEPN-like nuclease n=1 Tax=Okeania sp. SIO3B5 TaxID=2607811 RepID=UPI0013FEADCB|nr:MAE_28990/MAE_18760 family HEPN-like nuclease [Okeania sp. SIO3B5]NEO58482.1 hypothetical protein [Okeania sp. SIO3B5]